MDVIKLDTECVPVGVVENFDSMIWTERYYIPGEFELHTYDIATTLALLPINTFISLADTTQVMYVEEHEIESDENGVPSLTIRGRSLDALLESRYFMTWMQQTNDTSIEIPSYSSEATYPLEMAANIVNSNDDSFWINWHIFEPNHEIGSVIYLTGDTAGMFTMGADIARSIKRGPMDQVVRGLLAEIDAGIRSDRVKTIEYSVGVDASNALIAYKGVDRTESAGGNYVTFSTDNGDLRSVKYLKTVKNLKNVAIAGWIQDIVPSPITGPPMVQHNSFDLTTDAFHTTSPLSGINRKEIYVETRQVLNSDYVGDDYYGAREMARVELRKYQRTVFITAELSETLASAYGTSYYLGDFITVRIGFGISTDMQVSEFTRISDTSGERAYPTLTEQL
jgi:hypothetical protein